MTHISKDDILVISVLLADGSTSTDRPTGHTPARLTHTAPILKVRLKAMGTHLVTRPSTMGLV